MKASADDRLYGEETTQGPEFRVHCETLHSRSSLHRFEIGLHRHESLFQILYISSGDGDARINGETVSIAPPSAIVVPPGFEHGFRFSPDIEGFILTALTVSLPASAQVLLRQAFSRPALVRLAGQPDHAGIIEIVTRFAGEHAGTLPGRDALLDGLLATLVVLVARAAAPADASRSQETNTQRFEMLMTLIARHIREQQDVAFYARHVGLSSTHLNRLVRERSGLSLRRLIARRQIELAQQELVFTQSTVQMIATGLGFADPAYFTRFFQRETGMTPRAWRVAERQKLDTFRSPADLG